MSLKNSINSDARTLFINQLDFAEGVTYAPRQQSGKPPRLPRNINAVVFRDSMTTVDEDNNETITPTFRVHVANDSTFGISSQELDCGGDQIIFPIRDYLSPVARTIMSIEEQDHGMLVLLCR
jgi:hypothetical protein